MIEIAKVSLDLIDSINMIINKHSDLFVPRIGNLENKTISGEAAVYESITCQDFEALNPIKYNDLLLALPKYKGLIASDIVINRYLPGSFIPLHTDIQAQITSSILFLSSGHEVFSYINDSGDEVTIKDQKGLCIHLLDDEILGGVKHKVSEVKGDTRYTAIILY